MNFEQFCKEFKVTEVEAHQLVHYLAYVRMNKTLDLAKQIKPDKTAAQIIDESRQPARE